MPTTLLESRPQVQRDRARVARTRGIDGLTDTQRATPAFIQQTNKPLYRAYLLKEQLHEIVAIIGSDGKLLLPAWNNTRLRVLARQGYGYRSADALISICRDHSINVKRWRGGQMALRWCAAGMVEPPSSSAALTVTCTYPSSATRWSVTSAKLSHRTAQSDQDCGLTITGPPPRFHGTRDMHECLSDSR
jgi:hypothetical protein